MADDKHPISPLEALNARGLTAKREYVRGLEQRRDPEALSLLVECLCDESWFLRDLAEQTFFRLGEEHAGPLVPLLSGGLWYTRLSGARLLGRLGYRPAVPALIDLGDDTNETVALAARDALLSVARQRGSARVAHALQRATPERRKRRLEEIAARDRAIAKNLERLMADVDLMASDAPDRLIDPVESGEPAAAAPKPAHRSFLSSKPFAAPRPAAAKPPAATKPAAAPAPAGATKSWAETRLEPSKPAEKAPAPESKPAGETKSAASPKPAAEPAAAPQKPPAEKSHAAPRPAAAPKPAPPPAASPDVVPPKTPASEPPAGG